MYACTYVYMRTSQVALVVKNLPANAGDRRNEGLISGSGTSPGGELGNHSRILAWRMPIDRGAWQTIVRGVTKSWTRLTWLSTAHMYILKLHSVGVMTRYSQKQKFVCGGFKCNFGENGQKIRVFITCQETVSPDPLSLPCSFLHGGSERMFIFKLKGV